MLLGFYLWPGNGDFQARDYTCPLPLARDSVDPYLAADELLDYYVAGDACFAVDEGEDETHFIDGNGLFDGADGAFVSVCLADHVLRDFYVHLEHFRLALRPIEVLEGGDVVPTMFRP